MKTADMKKIMVINGPNLNMLGKREPHVYGSQTLDEINNALALRFPSVTFEFFQSNIEGEIVGAVQRCAGEGFCGLIINAGAYSHYSYAVRDALALVSAPKIEVHISNIYARDEFRRHSVLSPVCNGVLCGFGAEGYRLAVEALIK